MDVPIGAPDTACAERLRVTADPSRLAVLRRLVSGPLRVSELNDHLGLEQSLLSHHLRVLREAGMVEAMREGRSVRYRLAPDVRPEFGADSIHLGCCRILFEE